MKRSVKLYVWGDRVPTLFFSENILKFWAAYLKLFKKPDGYHSKIIKYPSECLLNKI